MLLDFIDYVAERWLSRRSDGKIARFAKEHPEFELEDENLERVEIGEDGLILNCVSPAIVVLAEEAAKMLDAAHAENYLQLDIIPRLARDMRAIRLTVQWAEGKSPCRIVDELKAELAAIRGNEVARVLWVCSEGDDCGLKAWGSSLHPPANWVIVGPEGNRHAFCPLCAKGD